MARIFNVAVVGLFVAILLVGANGAYADSGVETLVTNETVVIDYSNASEVDVDGDRYRDSVTILDKNDEVLEEGTHYEWDAENGTISWYDTPETADGENATVTYTAVDRTDVTKASKQILTVLGGGIWVVLFGVCIFGAFRLSTGGAGGGGGL